MSGVAIIGAGLAGTACAYELKRAGLRPVIFEAGDDIAGGASGNAAGIYNPRLSGGFTAEAQFYALAYRLAERVLQDVAQSHPAIRLSRHGTLHLATDDDRRRKFKGVLENWDWNGSVACGLDADEASKVAGVPVRHDALWLPGAGSVSPAALCRAYADGAEAHLNTPLAGIEQTETGWRVAGQDFDAVILACGSGVKYFGQTAWLPVHTVRGQILTAETSGAGEDLRCTLCYGGYIAPGQEGGAQVLGSTFQKWLTHTDILEEDNAEIVRRLREAAPDLDGPFHALSARAGLRVSAQDRFPVAGAVPDAARWARGERTDLPGLYVSTAHGSHGIVSSIAAARMIAEDAAGLSPSLPEAARDALSPARFPERARRKGAPLFAGGHDFQVSA